MVSNLGHTRLRRNPAHSLQVVLAAKAAVAVRISVALSPLPNHWLCVCGCVDVWVPRAAAADCAIVELQVSVRECRLILRCRNSWKLRVFCRVRRLLMSSSDIFIVRQTAVVVFTINFLYQSL